MADRKKEKSKKELSELREKESANAKGKGKGKEKGLRGDEGEKGDANKEDDDERYVAKQSSVKTQSQSQLRERKKSAPHRDELKDDDNGDERKKRQSSHPPSKPRLQSDSKPESQSQESSEKKKSSPQDLKKGTRMDSASVLSRSSGDANNNERRKQKQNSSLIRAHEKNQRNTNILENISSEGDSKGKFAYSCDLLSSIQESKDASVVKKLGGCEKIAKGLKTDLKNGLTSSDVDDAERKEAFGTNQYEAPDQNSFFHFIKESMADHTLIILMIGAVVSLILNVYDNPSTGWMEGTAILAAVIIVVTVTSFNNWNQERQFRKLSEISSDIPIDVVRDGKVQKISIHELVVGDVVVLTTGSTIPADGLIFHANALHVDESGMTGESDTPVKSPTDAPFAISGCQIISGTGKMLVTAVGKNSERGKIRELLIKPSELTPLQQKLERVANQIGMAGMAVAVLTFIVLTIKLYMNKDDHNTASILRGITSNIIAAITIVVVAVPEGLPLAVTVALAYSMMKMYQDNNLVRHLGACETMGGATCICSDKTGTLTQNNMTVVSVYIGNELFEIHHHKKIDMKADESVMLLLKEAIALNTSAYYGSIKGTKQIFGNKTEVAMIKFLKRHLGMDVDDIRKKSKTLAKMPFSSDLKRACTLAELSTTKKNDRFILFTTGAPDLLMSFCKDCIDLNGETVDLDEKAVSEVIEKMNSQALRTIGIAYKHLDESTAQSYRKNGDESDINPDDGLEKDSTLLGIIAIKDPLREEVADAVKKCQSAGITVRLVTGDSLETANAIGRECGIKTQDGISLKGSEFRQMSDDEILEKLPKIQVLARSNPIDKHRLVTLLREMNAVVAVTGDGTNDAPSLKEADVGFAMGQCGTEVAKEASDIILLDDNFSTIVKAIVWGRNVYDSIRKFLQFQLTVNLVALVVAFVSAVTYGHSVLTPVQMLWINLIMDTLGALALATEAPTEKLLERKPYGRNDNLLNKSMIIFICVQCTYQIMCLFWILNWGADVFEVEQDSVAHRTIIFNAFVLAQIINEWNCRKVYFEYNIFSNITRNPIFIIVIVLTLLTQGLIVQYGGTFLSTTPLNLKQWLLCGLIGLFSLPIALLTRIVASKIWRR